ncbi:anti-sigma B factor antagonist [Hamadaea flava]|uniref:Anti-sigma factor antagonist n=1 Tax=Hamadaea flava TaxID=1742688 RepID=A0ABV8LLB8_9ACTN|nr:STAS domain-containing protein [Hamadaea flava]MCP2324493.1 anti-sigma B factor antagonist [Hamadaea flava]
MATHTARVVGDDCVVTLSGEIDMSNSSEVETWLNEAIERNGCSRLEVDLGPLDFLDSFGIRALLRGRERADSAGVAYRLTNPNALVERILRTLGLYDHLATW